MMNSLKHTLFILLVFLCSMAYSQDIRLGFQTGIGSYDMEDLKGLNDEVFKGLPFQAEIISNYPSYWYYKPSFILAFNRFSLGVQASYYSTGARISSKDYSGAYLFDTRIQCLAPGIYGDFALFRLFEKCKVSMYAEGGVTFSKLSLKEDLTVMEEDLSNSSFEFKSRNYYVEPGLKLEYPFSQMITVGLNGGWFAQFGTNDLASEKGEVLTRRNNAAGPDWGGIRLGVSLSVALFHQKETAE